MSKYKFQSLICPSERVTEEQLETDRKLLAFDRSLALLSRRGFMAQGALTAAGLAAAASMSAGRAEAQTATTPPITDVLNFALNLEYLECNLYLYVSTGSGLITTNAALAGTGASAVQNPPGKLTLDTTTMAVAQALANDELNHISDLRAAITSLSGTPIAQPAINLGFKGAITTQMQFIMTARQFTAVGGSAYIGSAQYLISNPTVLQEAAQILGAEGYHDGVLNYLCVNQGIASPAVDALDVIPTTSTTGTPFFTANAQGLPPARTTSQVLGIVYGLSMATTTTPAAGTASGGFFPSGFNGNIKTT